jgi:hypothetical protein
MLHSVKSKIVSKALTDTKDKERRKLAWSSVVTGLQTTLRIVKETTAGTSVPGLQTGLSSLLLVLDVIKVGGDDRYPSVIPNVVLEIVSKYRGCRETRPTDRRID